MNEYEVYFKKAADFHGHACAGIALGTKMALAGMRYLGFDPAFKNKNLIAFVECDRCMADAVQVVTGCKLGHRSLKLMDYGKFAASFMNTENGRAVRVTVHENFDSSGPVDALAARLAEIRDDELITLEDIKISIEPVDMPGHPHQRTCCQVCGERVVDGREKNIEGKTYCRACAGEGYYSRINLEQKRG